MCLNMKAVSILLLIFLLELILRYGSPQWIYFFLGVILGVAIMMTVSDFSFNLSLFRFSAFTDASFDLYSSLRSIV